MTGALRRIVAPIVVIAVGSGLVLLYREHQREVAREAAREEPVVAPSRLVEEKGTVMVALDSLEARRVGLALAALAPVRARPERRLPAEVVPEQERTAVLRAPVAGRLAVAPGARWPSLGERVPAGVAIAQVSDARPLTLPLGGVVTSIGARPGSLVEAGQSLLEVADYTHPLVRVTWLDLAPGMPPKRLALSPAETAPRVRATLIGPALEADPLTRRPAYLYRADRAWPGATPGTPVAAIVPGLADSTRDDVLVPDTAVVQWEGLTWAYVARAPGRFQRVRIMTTRPLPGGWVAGPPLAPGDLVVVRGAEELLSEEFRARVTVGDESGE
jgi:multidrug efflux system membrane fusion protein